MTIEAGLANPWNMEGWHAKTCTGEKGRAHGVGDIACLALAIDAPGTDPKGLIRLNYINQPDDVVNKPTSAPTIVQKLDAEKNHLPTDAGGRNWIQREKLLDR